MRSFCLPCTILEKYVIPFHHQIGECGRLRERVLGALVRQVDLIRRLSKEGPSLRSARTLRAPAAEGSVVSDHVPAVVLMLEVLHVEL